MGIFIQLIVAIVLVSGCNGKSRSSEKTNEDGQTEKFFQIEFIDSSFVGWRPAEGQTMGKALAFDASGNPLKYGDGSESENIRMTSGEGFKYLEFHTPAGAAKWKIELNPPNRACLPSLTELEIASFTNGLKIEGNCKYVLSGKVEGLEEDLTVVYNGEQEYTITPGEGSVDVEFSIPLTDVTFANAVQHSYDGDKAEEDTKNFDSLFFDTYYTLVGEENSISKNTFQLSKSETKTATFELTTKDTKSACTIEGGTGDYELRHDITWNRISPDNSPLAPATLPFLEIPSRKDLVIRCAKKAGTYAIGGKVTGHSGDVVLSLGDEQITVKQADISYRFSELAPEGEYKVAVETSPSNQNCTVAAAGSVASLAADVTDADVTCSTTVFHALSGTATGLTGTVKIRNQMTLQVLTIAMDGAFSFNPISHGEDYDIRVLLKPAGQTCTLTNYVGTANADVTDITVTCIP